MTPRARIELERLDQVQQQVLARFHESSVQLDRVVRTVADIEASLPAVLNAISSMSGVARVVKREVDALRSDIEVAEHRSAAACDRLDGFRTELEAADHRHAAFRDQVNEQIAVGDLDVLSQVRPHVETLTWLMQRVEMVRFEMLNELRYGGRFDERTSIEPKVLNPMALEVSPLRVNIGAGHIPMDGYVNVDMRELPGIDVIATLDELPFEADSIDEIYSSHTLEHIPHELLRRHLLPYWATLLKPGGTLVTIAPDLEAMSADYARGDTSFEDFREVVYGGQEYEGDTHFTGFTPASFSAMIVEAGLIHPTTVAADRQNGKCKEFEVTARKAG